MPYTPKRIVALDIDGTIGDYHHHFLRFAEAWCGKPMPKAKDNPGLPLYQFMHVSKATYRACKLAFRQGGMKRSMPVYPGARELTRHIRQAGAEVWICTTRPYLRLDNIDPDTRHWLRRNGIQYDGVIFGQSKYRDLSRIAGPRVLMVVDDLPEMIESAWRSIPGTATLMRDQPYNRHTSNCDIRVYSCAEIQKCFDNLFKEYKECQTSSLRENRALALPRTSLVD